MMLSYLNWEQRGWISLYSQVPGSLPLSLTLLWLTVCVLHVVSVFLICGMKSRALSVMGCPGNLAVDLGGAWVVFRNLVGMGSGRYFFILHILWLCPWLHFLMKHFPFIFLPAVFLRHAHSWGCVFFFFSFSLLSFSQICTITISAQVELLASHFSSVSRCPGVCCSAVLCRWRGPRDRHYCSSCTDTTSTGTAEWHGVLLTADNGLRVTDARRAHRLYRVPSNNPCTASLLLSLSPNLFNILR